MEVPHTNLTEVTGVVLVEVSTVVVLTTGHTATTGVLAVLANATVTGGDMTAAVERERTKVSNYPVTFMMCRSVRGMIEICHVPFFFFLPAAGNSRLRKPVWCQRNERKKKEFDFHSLFSCLAEAGRHLVDGAVLDKTGLRIWRWYAVVVCCWLRC